METTPLYFVHVTDTHLNGPHKKTLLDIDTLGHLRDILDHVQKLSVKPAFIIITGDLAHEGDADDYRFVRQLLDSASAQLGVPILVALGNHDHRGPFHEGYLNAPGSEAAYHYAEHFDGLRLLVLDSHWPGHDEGRLDDEQLAWLKAELASSPVPALLAVHHPPHTNSFFTTNEHLLQNADALAEAIAGQPVLGILSGHIHFNSVNSFHGALSAAGQGAAFGLDATDKTGMRMLNVYGYNLGMLNHGVLSIQPFTMPSDRRELLFMTFEDMLRHREQFVAPQYTESQS